MSVYMDSLFLFLVFLFGFDEGLTVLPRLSLDSCVQTILLPQYAKQGPGAPATSPSSQWSSSSYHVFISVLTLVLISLQNFLALQSQWHNGIVTGRDH